MAQTQPLRTNDQVALREAGVGLAIVFGSTLTGHQHPDSDVDIGVLFSSLKQKESDPVGVYGTLFDIFSSHFPDKKLDIVYLQEAPLSLQFKAVMDGELIYSTSPTFAANFKEYVMKMYFDFKPVEDEFEQALFGSRI